MEKLVELKERFKSNNVLKNNRDLFMNKHMLDEAIMTVKYALEFEKAFEEFAKNGTDDIYELMRIYSNYRSHVIVAGRYTDNEHINIKLVQNLTFSEEDYKKIEELTSLMLETKVYSDKILYNPELYFKKGGRLGLEHVKCAARIIELKYREMFDSGREFSKNLKFKNIPDIVIKDVMDNNFDYSCLASINKAEFVVLLKQVSCMMRCEYVRKYNGNTEDLDGEFKFSNFAAINKTIEENQKIPVLTPEVIVSLSMADSLKVIKKIYEKGNEPQSAAFALFMTK